MPIALKKHLYSAYSRVVDILLPATCPISGEIIDHHHTVSNQVWNNLFFIDEPSCDFCSKPFDYEIEGREICLDCDAMKPIYDKALCVLRYDEVSRSLILKFKHADHTELAPMFGRWLATRGKDFIEKADYIFPIPLHSRRLFSRRYNQAGLIAKEMVKAHNLRNESIKKRIDFTGLKRVRNTLPQGTNKAGARKINVKDAFCVSDDLELKGKTILLIDDVLTSGATVNECAKLLKEKGAGKVFVLAVAKA
ncbi:MAG: amidophosphoribosyltransferase [Rickettsiales bacterium]|nr:amidophosphoribosyltransferase [Rickettsiales bacterium]